MLCCPSLVNRPVVAISGMKRFGLRSVFLGVTLCALSLGYLSLLLRDQSLRHEIKSLKAEVGQLVLVDELRVNVVEVPTLDPFTWRWRVFAPPGTLFEAGAVTEQIPMIGAPSPRFTRLEIPDASNPNGVLITASVRNNLDSGYVIILDLGNGNSIEDLTLQSREDFLDGGSFSIETAGRGRTEIYGFDEPIILHRRRFMNQTSPTTMSAPKGNTRGLMFWITPKKPSSSSAPRLQADEWERQQHLIE